MKNFLTLILILFVISEVNSQHYKTDARLIVNDTKIHQIIPENVQIEMLAEGHEWTEGPLWLETENKLIYSDIPQNAIFEWSENDGKKIYLKPAGYTGNAKRGGETGSNGLLLNAEDELILCQHGNRRIAKMNSPLSQPSSNFISLAELFEGKKFNSPNDAAFHKNGDLYFTDPPYGLEFKMDDPAKEIDFQGVYRLEKNGKVSLLAKELSRPNGIAFSPDFRKLYVANSDPKKAIVMVYELNEKNEINNGKLFYDVTQKVGQLKGLPDGLKVHPNGWIFATGPGGVLVFTPEGKHLGTIYTREATANCAFNTDYSALFITADNYLLRVKLK